MGKTKLYTCSTLLLLCFLWPIINIKAQHIDTTANRPFRFTYRTKNEHLPKDTAKTPYLLKTGNYYLLNENLYYATKDTLVYVSDTSIIQYSHDENSINFYSRLQHKSNKNRLTREIYKQLIREQKSISKKPFVRRDKELQRFEGKTIQTITFKSLDIFGASILDTAGTTRRKPERFANKTHTYSKPYFIKNILLFKEGDKVSAITLADNERLLRETKAIYEAKFIVMLSPDDTNKVDILVLTQDGFPYEIGGQIYDINRGRVDLIHNNILGTTHQLINRVFYDGSDRKDKGYYGTYRIPNIKNTFTALDVEYFKLFYKSYTGIRVYRDFFTPDTKYAGAFSFYVNDENPEILIGDSIRRKRLEYSSSDIWLGRNFNLKRDYLIKGFRPGINLSARYSGRIFNSRPDIYADSSELYYNYHRFLGKLGYSNQKFFESNMIYSSGKTEDIPTGYLIEAIGGVEFDDFNERIYFGANFAFASALKRKFYLYSQLGTGTYYHSLGFEQGVLRFYGKIFSPLIKTRGPLLRQFFTLGYTQGFFMKDYQNIGLDNEFGIRSWNKTEPLGKYRLTISSETVMFPKWYFYGVGSTFFGFADIGMVGNTPGTMLNNTVWASIGTGFRLRNNNFVFNSIEIRIAWFPKVPEGKYWNFYTSSEQTLNLNELKPGIPEVIPFY